MTGHVQVIRGMPEQEYRARPEASQSDFKRLRAPTPAHAKWEIDHPREASDSMAIGTCLHALVLEGRKVYAVAPKCDGRTKEGKATRAAFETENEGKIILSAEDGAKVEGMAAGIFRNRGAVLLLESARDRELSVFWHGQKARLDGSSPVGVIDLKTTKSAEERDFSASCETYGYAIQAAHYLDAATAAGLPNEDFYIIASESFGSFECAVYKIAHAALAIGRQELGDLRTQYFRCMETGEWPGYSQEPVEIKLPRWKHREFEEENQ